MLDQTDATLVSQVLLGKRECYRPLVEKYKTRLYHIGCSLLNDPVEAQDISQEAFLTAYKNLRELKDRMKFGSWIFGIMRNLCLEMLRKKRRLPEFMDELPELDIDNVLEMRPSDQSGADLLESVIHRLNALPEKHRILITLKYLEDYSYQEIAEMLEIPVDLVRSRLYEGRRMLREGVTHARSQDYGL